MSTLPLTEEQYLELDRAAERKSEFYGGEMFAMAGAGFNHNIIVANLVANLRGHLRDKFCLPIANDMRLRIGPGGRTRIPTSWWYAASPKSSTIGPISS